MAPGHRERYDKLKNTEEQRNKLVEELLAENDRLQNNLEKTTHRLERDNDTVELYQQRSKEATAKLEALQKNTDISAYVCVLIDGDDLHFRDQLVKNASLGGHDAAQLLRGAITNYISGLGIRRDVEVVLYVYANVYALIRTYRDSRLLRENSDLDRFISAFNKSYPLFNFIDAGSGKECVNSKIRESFKLHVRNMHCKLVMLGASTESGYTRLLDKCIGERTIENRITLLEGSPFSKEFSRLSGLLKTTSFPQVFRNAKIETPTQISSAVDRHGSISYQNAPAESKAPEDRFLESLAEYSKRKVEDDDISKTNRDGEDHDRPPEHIRRASLRDYTSGTHPNGEDWGGPLESGRRSSLRENIGGIYSSSGFHSEPLGRSFSGSGYHRGGDAGQRFGGRSSKQSESETIEHSPEYFMDAPFGFIARNRLGQRVDVPLTQPPQGMISEIKRRKICNDYCLRGKCPNFHCKHEHPKKLNNMELHVLRDVARSFPCPAGLDCSDRDCFHGHRCPVDPCGFVQDRICRYPPELHDTDNIIVNKEDLDKLKSDSYDESHILGVASKPHGAESMSTAVEPRRVQTGEPRFRNLSMTFEKVSDGGPGRGSSDLKSISTGQMPPPASNSTSTLRNGHAAASSESYLPSTNTNLEDSAPVTGISTSPLKRTADEAGHEPKTAASPSSDPRLRAQKRMREASA